MSLSGCFKPLACRETGKRAEGSRVSFVTDGRKLIERAYREKFAIVAFNVSGLDAMRGCIQAAEAEMAPIMLQTSPGELASISSTLVGRLVRALAHEASVPIILHLDHGESLGRIGECIRAGYSSVMFDGDDLTLSDNVATTKAVADFAHGAGLCVEAAAGSFGSGEAGGSDVHLTDPESVRLLRERGEADMIACSVGSRHGESSTLDLERLEEISTTSHAPLVLHGGTGIAPGDVTSAVSLGVVKLNIGAAIMRAAREVWCRQFGSGEEIADLNKEIVRAVRDAAREKIKLTNSGGKA